VNGQLLYRSDRLPEGVLALVFDPSSLMEVGSIRVDGKGSIPSADNTDKMAVSGAYAGV